MFIQLSVEYRSFYLSELFVGILSRVKWKRYFVYISFVIDEVNIHYIVVFAHSWRSPSVVSVFVFAIIFQTCPAYSQTVSPNVVQFSLSLSTFTQYRQPLPLFNCSNIFWYTIYHEYLSFGDWLIRMCKINNIANNNIRRSSAKREGRIYWHLCRAWNACKFMVRS